MTTPNNYIPGDWPDLAARQAANEEAFTSGEAQELSGAVQVTEAAQTSLNISGDERTYAGQIKEDVIGAPSTLTPDLQGKQKSQTPYVGYHLFP
jgi:hypothetical protein